MENKELKERIIQLEKDHLTLIRTVEELISMNIKLCEEVKKLKK